MPFRKVVLDGPLNPPLESRLGVALPSDGTLAPPLASSALRALRMTTRVFPAPLKAAPPPLLYRFRRAEAICSPSEAAPWPTRTLLKQRSLGHRRFGTNQKSKTCSRLRGFKPRALGRELSGICRPTKPG